MCGIDLDLLLGADDDVGMLLLEAAIRYMLKFTEHVCARVHVSIIWATPQFFLWFLGLVFSFSSRWYIGRAEISIALSLGDFVILKWWVAIFMKKYVLVLNLCSVVWWKIWNTTFVNLICRWVLDVHVFAGESICTHIGYLSLHHYVTSITICLHIPISTHVWYWSLHHYFSHPLQFYLHIPSSTH